MRQMLKDGKWGDVIGLGLLAAALTAYGWVFGDVLPRADGLGADYSFFLPRLLAGHYHFVTNGAFHIPWFSPAQCGGLPFYADPQIPYFALPQWLTFAFGPVQGVILSTFIVAALGGLGLYVLMRTRFGASPAAAVVGAVLFMFNGMYVARMGEGHLSFQPFVLAPWAALAVLAPAASQRWRLTRTLGAVIITGLVFAVAFHGGMVHLLIPMGLTVAAVVAIHGGLKGHAFRPWLAFGAGGVVAILLSVQKLVAAAAYLSQFPRDYYPLPGFASLTDALLVPLWAVFWSPPGDAAFERMANTGWYAGLHEWDFSIGPVAALLILAGVVALVVRAFRHGGLRVSTRVVLTSAMLVAIFTIPVAGNVYTPEWNAFLKELPLVSSTVLMIRWYAVYLLPAALAAGLALDLLRRDGRLLWAAAGVAIVATVAWNASIDRSRDGGYPGGVELAGWASARSAETVPPITDIMPINAAQNSGLAIGFSPVPCYQPMFGYRLETFPRKELRPGPALSVVADRTLNVKNPACYVFPEANACEPGDHFSIDQRDEAALFLSYRNFPFERSTTQKIAGQVNLWTPLALLLLLAGAAVVDRRRSHAAAVPPSDAPNA